MVWKAGRVLLELRFRIGRSGGSMFRRWKPALAVGVAAVVWLGPAAADGYGDLIRCARLAEPLMGTAEICTSAIRSGDLTEAQVGEAFLYRGIIAYMLEQYGDALSDLNLSIQYAPEAGRAYYFKGLVYEAEGEDGRADGQFRNAYAYAPGDPDILAKMLQRNLLN